ncbi:MAG: hypothetical protein ACREM8_03465, partial [Vulcanimicrobiaceae bacterium]
FNPRQAYRESVRVAETRTAERAFGGTGAEDGKGIHVIVVASRPPVAATARQLDATDAAAGAATGANLRDAAPRPTAIAAPRISLRLFEGWGPRIAP